MIDKDVQHCIDLWLEARHDIVAATEALEKVVPLVPSVGSLIMRLHSVRTLMNELAELLTVLAGRLR